MNECPTCQRLREYAEYVSRFDYRDGREAWKRLQEHQTRDHVLHVATPKEPVKLVKIAS